MKRSKRYNKARTISVEEALGTRFETKTPLEQAAVYNRTKEELKEASEQLGARLSSYKKTAASDRTEIEEICCKTIALSQKMARSVHPLSAYGRQALKNAVAVRQAFEDRVGPLVTPITANNIDLFQTVLSEEIRDSILSGKCGAIGAVRTRKATQYGVGALAYHFEYLTAYQAEELCMDWLFVHKKFRKKSVAHHLIGELIDRMEYSRTDYLTAVFPADTEDNALLGHLLHEWGIDLTVGVTPDAYIRIGDITGYGVIKTFQKRVMPLSNFGTTSQPLLIQKALKELGYSGYLLNGRQPQGYFDQRTSCYIGRGPIINALLLTHKASPDTILTEYIGAPSAMKDAPKHLLGFMLEKAIRYEEDDTVIRIPVDDEGTGEFLDKVSPKQLGLYLVGGTLEKPLKEIDPTA